MVIDQQTLRQCLLYDPLEGKFNWIERRKGRRIESLAGGRKASGYVYICINKVSYLAHRLAWLYMTGAWPKNEVDHIDGNRSNNKWENLRDVSRSVNMQNQRKISSRNKSSGLLGASYHKKSGLFMAKIIINKKQVYLGLFETAELAHNAYVNLKRKTHPGCTI